jgi:hypothetical protein
MKMPLNHHFRLDPQFSLIVEKNDMASETTPLTAKSGADADDHLRRLKAYQWCVAIGWIAFLLATDPVFVITNMSPLQFSRIAWHAKVKRIHCSLKQIQLVGSQCGHWNELIFSKLMRCNYHWSLCQNEIRQKILPPAVGIYVKKSSALKLLEAFSLAWHDFSLLS